MLRPHATKSLLHGSGGLTQVNKIKHTRMYANYCIDVATQQMQTKKYLQLLYHNDTTVWYHGMEVFVVVE